jgi:tetratricopeptide (TPR) repeat protein
MALFGFGKKKTEEAAGGTATSGNGGGTDDGKGTPAGFQPDERKAKSWFDRAHKVADTNHDYAIDCFVSGLRFQPDALREHEALYEVGVRRLVAGGKPAGMGLTMQSGGKTTIEKMTHAEKLWAMDPRNAQRVMAVMEKAAELHETEESVDLGEVVVWLGGKVVELNTGKKATKSVFVKAMELFESVKAYKQAEEACRRAIQMDGDDGQLISKMKDLAAMKTIEDANLKKGSTFRDGVKDLDKQKALDEEDQMHHDDAGHDRMIARARDAWKAKPDDIDLRLKVVKALLAKTDDDADEEAIALLREAYEKTGQYRFKFDIGDVTMRQYHRHYRMLKDNLASDPSMAKEMEDLRKRQLAFELEEFTERVAQYPTLMKLRYELGKRMIQAKKYEEAVAHFQDSKGDSKIKVQSMEALVICYLHMEWLEPAVDTLEEAIKAHPLPDDELAKSLKYLQIDALERYARKFNSLEHARKAQAVASTLLQIDIRYRDIREKVNRLRDLVAEMSKKA